MASDRLTPAYCPTMRFDLVDRVLEQSADRIVTIKNVTAAEEYLQDHFPTFPVLPGVLMLEAMVQAGRRLLDAGAGAGSGPGSGTASGPGFGAGPLAQGRVRALKYGRFIKPGDAMRVTVERLKDPGDGTHDLRGEVAVVSPGVVGDGTPALAASGRFALRPVRLATRQP